MAPAAVPNAGPCLATKTSTLPEDPTRPTNASGRGRLSRPLPHTGNQTLPRRVARTVLCLAGKHALRQSPHGGENQASPTTTDSQASGR